MIKKEIIIGFIVGIIANAIGLFFATIIFSKGEDITIVLKTASAEGFLGKLITLGALLNLLTFFVFIKKKQDYRARGVLLATVFIAVFTFIINFN